MNSQKEEKAHQMTLEWSSYHKETGKVYYENLLVAELLGTRYVPSMHTYIRFSVTKLANIMSEGWYPREWMPDREFSVPEAVAFVLGHVLMMKEQADVRVVYLDEMSDSDDIPF